MVRRTQNGLSLEKRLPKKLSQYFQHLFLCLHFFIRLVYVQESLGISPNQTHCNFASFRNCLKYVGVNLIPHCWRALVNYFKTGKDQSSQGYYKYLTSIQNVQLLAFLGDLLFVFFQDITRKCKMTSSI